MSKESKFFSIVMPIYNMQRFLQSALNSLINQAVDFSQDIEVILVDDGSDDDSDKICKEFRNAHPENVIYVHQEHSGVASARNLGLRLATGTWIGFLDPDDTYSLNMLSELRKAIIKFPDVNFFSTPMHTFERIKRSHRLNYKFKKTRVIDITSHPDNIQLSAASVFINRSSLVGETFPEHLSVGEDMVFVNRILAKLKRYGVLSNVRYHYRKRYDQSSVMDTIEDDAKRYLPYIQSAMLDEIPKLLEDGVLPEYFQNVFLYEISGKVRTVTRPEPLKVEEDFKRYLNLLNTVLQYVDDDVILRSRFVDSHRAHVLKALKNDGKLKLLNQIFSSTTNAAGNNIVAIDSQGKVAKKLSNVMLNVTNFSQSGEDLRILGYFDTFFDFRMFDIYFENRAKTKIPVNVVPDVNNGCFFIGETIKEIFKISAILPSTFLDGKVYLIVKDASTGVSRKVKFKFVGRKTRLIEGITGSFTMLGDRAVYYDSEQKSLLFTRDKERLAYFRLNANMMLGKSRAPKGRWQLRDVRDLAPHVAREFQGKTVNVFMDRVAKADDNAEVLAKYFDSRKTKNEINVFVIRATSPDFERLKDEGVNVVPYGSLEHLKFLLAADNLIVSQVAWAVVEPFFEQYKGKIKDLFKFNLIFLQHGVIMCDVSEVLKKSKVGIDRFITSAHPEHADISGDAYEYDRDEVVLTGLPRHDNLTRDKGKYIAVMPTWSRDVVSQARSNDLRLAMPSFKDTAYFSKWNSLLNNKLLIDQVTQQGYELIFLPHPEIRSSVHMFDLDNVTLADFNVRYVDIINQSSCVITDRSSVFMDFAYAAKKVFYYRPYDNNNYEDGFFEFDRDGFGPVSTDEDMLVSQLIESMTNGFAMEPEYVKRRDSFFAYDDSNNSERVYNAIKHMSKY